MQDQQPTVEDSFQKPLIAGKKPISHARQGNRYSLPNIIVQRSTRSKRILTVAPGKKTCINMNYIVTKCFQISYQYVKENIVGNYSKMNKV